MTGNIELLNFIYQNSEMGVEVLQKLISINSDVDFNNCLERQLLGYRLINNKAVKELIENGCEEKGIGKLLKIQSYIILNLQTLMDKSPSHLSEMLINGSTMGVIDAIKKCNQYSGSKESILELMRELREFEEGNIEELKKFL